MRFKSASEPSLAQASTISGQSSDQEGPPVSVEARHTGGIHWGARCQMYNTDAYKIKPKKVNGVLQKVNTPWVKDHHVCVAFDNNGLHPTLRHYFDQDGIESSFRNRGMHYGRKPKALQGLESPEKKLSDESRSSWGSIPSSLLDKLSYSSLIDSNSPGGLPELRKHASGAQDPHGADGPDHASLFEMGAKQNAGTQAGSDRGGVQAVNVFFVGAGGARSTA